ncbi:hypothetical protein XELAEV_18023079mg [Xenopus laevis]|uniref:Uncharacterized protein n=1 Tax=Xenopus laevis TaxID=8355 RepID=A0A974HNS2_XENLA|nr:hypothetical protein XELAEV_18023079mg [Xenopus laevis]
MAPNIELTTHVGGKMMDTSKTWQHLYFTLYLLKFNMQSPHVIMGKLMKMPHVCHPHFTYVNPNVVDGNVFSGALSSMAKATFPLVYKAPSLVSCFHITKKSCV